MKTSMHKSILLLLGATALLSIAGCGSADDPDRGTSRVQNLSLEGVVVDGRVARAQVFLDVNGDYIRNPFESYTFATVAASYAIVVNSHQLQQPGAVLRARGGIDRVTGETFHGILSRTIDTTGIDLTISPLTTLLSYMEPAQVNSFRRGESKQLDPQDDTYLSLTDLHADLSDFDSTLSLDRRVHLLKRSLQFHKLADVAEASLRELYGGEAIFDGQTRAANGSRLPRDLSGYLYRSMVEVMMEPQFVQNIDTQDILSAMVDNAAEYLAELTGQDEEAVSSDFKVQVKAMWDFIDDLFDATDDTLTREQLESRTRAVEVIATVLRDAADANIAAASIARLNALDVDSLGEATDVRGLAAHLIDTSGAGPDAATFLTRPAIDLTAIDRDFSLSSDENATMQYDPESGTLKLTYEGEVWDAEVEQVNDYTVLAQVVIAGIPQNVLIKSKADGDYDVSSY